MMAARWTRLVSAGMLVSMSSFIGRGQLARAVPASQSAAPVSPEDRRPSYLLQPQDVISIVFPLSPELNQTLTLQPDGFVSLQNAGSIYVQGLTLPEMVAAVKKAYTGVLHNPIVNIDLQDYQKPLFTVGGQVGKPGQYELRASIKVSEALAVAGGLIGTTAKTQVLLFHRVSHDWVEVSSVNMKAVLKGKDLQQDATLQAGDMIYVPEKFIANFRKYVPYSLNLGTYINETTL